MHVSKRIASKTHPFRKLPLAAAVSAPQLVAASCASPPR